MAINVECPACGKSYRRIRPELLGKKAQCPCGETFVLGTPADSAIPAGADSEADDGNSVDLSSVAIFENSYGDLDEILAGQGSTAPLKPQRPTNEAVESPPKPSSVGAVSPGTRPAKVYGNKAKSIGFLAALCSGTLAFWICMLIVKSHDSVMNLPLIEPLSQAINETSRGSFGDLTISKSLEQTFVAAGWTVWAVATCLLLLAIAQIINAFARIFRRRQLIRNIDGLTAIVAIALLFLVVGVLFLHSNHVSQVTRELNQLAVGQADGATVIAKNIEQLHAQLAQQSWQFIRSVGFVAAAPLLVFLLSAIRVYISLGETPDERSKSLSGAA